MSSEENKPEREIRPKEPRDEGLEVGPEPEGTAAPQPELAREGGLPQEPAPDDAATDPEPDQAMPEGAPDGMTDVEPEEVGDDDVTVALAAELEATRQERDEYLDALRRMKAEFDNSRKRAERERERFLRSASESVVREILPVLDNLERALEAGGDLREGVRATRDQLAEVLGREGLIPVDSDGQPFDPALHEAVMGQPSDLHEEGTVIQTFERGYTLNGRAIRPAKVVVARQV